MLILCVFSSRWRDLCAVARALAELDPAAEVAITDARLDVAEELERRGRVCRVFAALHDALDFHRPDLALVFAHGLGARDAADVAELNARGIEVRVLPPLERRTWRGT